MPLRAGDLDRLVTIERFALTRGANNEPLQGWTPVNTVAASWRRATSNERLASSQVGAQVTDIFEIRWTEELQASDPKDRLIYGGDTYDIVEVTEIGRHEGLLIRATTIVGEAE